MTQLLPRALRALPQLPGFVRHRGSVIFGATTADRLAVLQFNCLAAALATQDAFPRVDPQCLTWEHRRPLLIEEITRHSPDVVCLQEIDRYHDDFAPALEALGYDGLFLAKGRQVGANGSALFFSRNRFRVHTVEELVFADRLPEPSSQVALVVILAPRLASMPSDPAHLPEGSFCITTSHLKAGTDFEALRLAQAGILIDELVQLRQRHPHLPIVVAADMNTEPSGPIYSLLATGQAAVGDTASHNFDYRVLPLESAYSHYQPDWPGAALAPPTPLPPGAGRGRSEPAYTTWKHRPPVELCRVIDYIWFTSDVFCVDQLLELPGPDALPPTRLPCASYPSDHFALMAVLHFGRRASTG